MNEIRPSDPQFEFLLDELDDFLGGLDRQRLRRLQTEEQSFRAFCAYALQSIADRLGYIIVGLIEFMKDLGAMAAEGWWAGVARARSEALRHRR